MDLSEDESGQKKKVMFEEIVKAYNDLKDIPYKSLDHVYLLIDPLIANLPIENFHVFKPQTSSGLRSKSLYSPKPSV